MDNITLKKRIQNKFIKKPKGYIVLSIDKHTKLRIEYMFGAKYCIKKKSKKGISILSVLCDINDLIKIIEKEKLNKFAKFKPKSKR